jgi:hypothetical protein
MSVDTTPPPRALQVREALMARGLSARSATLYQRELWRIERWCEANGWTLKNVPASALTAYLETRPPTWATRKLIRHSLAHYWALAGRRNPPLWALPIPRKPRMRCRALEPDEARRLAKVARARGDRLGLAVLLALYLGLRREEIAQLRWADFLADGWLRVFGKGGTTAQLPLHPAVLNALAKASRSSEWVFPGQRQHRRPARRAGARPPRQTGNHRRIHPSDDQAAQGGGGVVGLLRSAQVGPPGRELASWPREENPADQATEHADNADGGRDRQAFSTPAPAIADHVGAVVEDALGRRCVGTRRCHIGVAAPDAFVRHRRRAERQQQADGDQQKPNDHCRFLARSAVRQAHGSTVAKGGIPS